MPNRIESVKCMQRWNGRQVPGPPSGPWDKARSPASIHNRGPRRGRASQRSRRERRGAHLQRPNEEWCVPEIKFPVLYPLYLQIQPSGPVASYPPQV
jgi:hypothetical protein